MNIKHTAIALALALTGASASALTIAGKNFIAQLDAGRHGYASGFGATGVTVPTFESVSTNAVQSQVGITIDLTPITFTALAGYRIDSLLVVYMMETEIFTLDNVSASAQFKPTKGPTYLFSEQSASTNVVGHTTRHTVLEVIPGTTFRGQIGLGANIGQEPTQCADFNPDLPKCTLGTIEGWLMSSISMEFYSITPQMSLVPVPAVPEPSTYALMLIGLVGLGAARFRGRSARAA